MASEERMGVKRPRTVPVSVPVKKYVKRCMNGVLETKYLQQAVDATNISATGTLAQAALFNINQGNTDATRTGNQIKVTRLKIRFTFASSVEDRIRIILLWDRQPNGAAAVIADVMAGTTYNAGFNKNNVVGHGGSRFTIVSDVTRTIQPFITATETTQQHIQTFTKSAKKTVTYGANGAAITDMATNNLFWVLFSSSGTGDLVGTLEVQYKDG